MQDKIKKIENEVIEKHTSKIASLIPDESLRLTQITMLIFYMQARSW